MAKNLENCQKNFYNDKNFERGFFENVSRETIYDFLEYTSFFCVIKIFRKIVSRETI